MAQVDPGGEARWWQRGVVYQVYPRSFQDSNGDGVGDLPGIRHRLDHLAWLGVDAIWLSPIFPSPMADFGYDCASYTGVDPLFGTLDDLDALLHDLHRRGMRLLLDFVPNHTSDRHPWFVDSSSSRGSARRSWYIWRDALPGGGPPNGWQSEFGGSAWEWHEPTGQYYFHSFLKEQPDLDWTNASVRTAIFEAMRFWLRRGVDGFRLDVVNLLAKCRELEPGPVDRPQRWGDRRRIHPIMRQLRAVADEFEERVLIGEIWRPVRELVRFYGQDLDELHLPFNFQLLQLPWQAGRLARGIEHYEGSVPDGAWPTWVIGNHDKPRIASRVGAAQARVAAMLLLTLRGTPTLYYGDEIGIADADVPPEQQRDPQGLRGGESRDPARTPMRWDGSALAGFSEGMPWLPIGPAVGTINVAAQRGDPASMLSLYRRLLELRRREPALSIGGYRALVARRGVLSYLRSHDGRNYAVALNLSDRRAEVRLELAGRVEASTHPGRDDRPVRETVELAANEGVVIAVDG